MTPAEVVGRYFEYMRAGDLAVVDVFTEDARLIGLGTVVEGRDAIRAFYGESIDAARPTPQLVGPLLVDGGRVAAEIEISLASGGVLHVVDLFVVEDEHIRSLTYFVADHPSRS